MSTSSSAPPNLAARAGPGLDAIAAPPFSVARTRVEMTQHVLPEFSNALGNIFGGQVVSWIDICAGIAAQRHCRSVVVTAAIDAVQFILPIKQGHIVILRGQVNATFRTSMECGVSVWSEDPLTGDVRKAMKAYATFVALDEGGRPKPVPPVVLLGDEDRRRAAAAATRRAARLATRSR
jgi:acyl-CoA hydrolase